MPKVVVKASFQRIWPKSKARNNVPTSAGDCSLRGVVVVIEAPFTG